MRKFLLDGNIYDRLEFDQPARDRIVSLHERGAIQIIATPMVVHELNLSPFRGVPPWFTVVVESDAVFILDYSILDNARLDDGVMYEQHLGQSTREIRDAIIAHTAHAIDATLVSEDRRCRERLKALAGAHSAMNYSDFTAWLGGASDDNLEPR